MNQRLESPTPSRDVASDEEFLISQILTNLNTDVALAKSWMIFAKSAFPQSFPVLFQCYKMECDDKNLTESALCLGELVKKFPNEIALIKELKSIADALSSDNNEFLKNIFETLPEEIKYDVMLAVTRNAQSIEEHCELMLLFLKRMPNSRLLQHGSNIIDTLLSAEDQPGMPMPINLFRKMLVCDALPLILKVSQFEYKFKVIFQLLQKAIEFYVCCLFTNPTTQDLAIRKEVILLSENNPDEVWKPLLQLFEIVAIRYRWSYPEMFVTNFNELSLQQLLSLLRRKNKLLASLTNDKHRREDTSGYEEAYFCLIVTFFYYLYTFGRIIHPKIFSNIVTGPYNFILMEGITFPPEDCKTLQTDFKRTERGYLVAGKYSSHEGLNMLIPSFVSAIECWELLHRHTHLLKDFNCLCTNIKLETWPIFQEFFLNSLIYGRAHREAMEHLGRIRENALDASHKTKATLQIASCYHFIGDYERSLKILLDIVINLPLTPTSMPPVNYKPSIGKCSVRYMHFMGFNNSEIIQYCVSMFLKLYKCKNKIDDNYKDRALGYMFVLMQYSIENEYAMLQKCIDSIKRAKTFCFPKFFNYIIDVDILEEISYLATPAGGNVNLEILSSPTFQASKQRAVTRGVNKGARDDLKLAFVNQMQRCYDNLDNLYIEFFKEEQNFLFLPLSDAL